MVSFPSDLISKLLKPSTCIEDYEVFWGQVSVEEGLCFACPQDKLAVWKATHECMQNKKHAHSWVPKIKSPLYLSNNLLYISGSYLKISCYYL